MIYVNTSPITATIEMKMNLNELIQKHGTKGLIFDLDGTLTHTLDQHVEAFYRAFLKHGRTVSRKLIQDEMGRRPTDITRDLIFDGQKDEDLSKEQTRELYEIAAEKVRQFKSLIPENPPLMPGLPDLIKKAKQRGLLIAVCSSTPLENVKILLDRIGLLDYFDALVTAEDVKIGKPHPEAFLKAVEKLSLEKDDCLVIGDSIHDVASVKNGGLKIIAVATGKHSIENLKAVNADHVVETLANLL